MRRYIPTGCLALLLTGGAVLRGESVAPLEAAVATPSDDALFGNATCIVMGRLSEKVQDTGGDRSAVIENVRPLLMRIMPSEVWPGSRPNEGVNLHLTDADTFKPGDEGIWILQQTQRGYVASAARSFRPASDTHAALESLDKWLRGQVPLKMKEALDALRKDPDGDAEATWKTLRQLAVLLECESISPLYASRPDDNPMRVDISAFYGAMGIELPVAPNPKTAAEIKRATPALKQLLYVGGILDHPEDPKYQKVFESCLADYWQWMLHRLNSSLAANPVEFAGEVEMRKRLAPAETVGRQFPPDVKVSRMLLFRGGAGSSAATAP